MNRRIFSPAAAAGLVLIAAACAEVPPSVPRLPAPDQAALPARPETPPSAPVDDARTLIGRSAREIAGLLGEPQLKRRDPPAELWQYRAARCVLDLFLYADKGNALTVAHIELRGGATDATRAECLRALTHASGGG
jgi:hypothetical protein